jgi:S-DNA-T family DNA segregation ATPase FtsK/SpoIIIE
MIHLSARRSPLSGLPLWEFTGTGVDECASVASKIKPLAEKPSADGAPALVVVLESFPDFVTTAAETPLLDLVKLARRNGHLVIAEGETSAWSSPWPLIQEVRNGRVGLLLQPDQSDGDTILRTSLPRVRRTDLPPGRGFWVRGGRARKVQIPLVD